MRERHVAPFVVMIVIFLFVGSLLSHGQSIAGGGGGVQAPYTNTYVMPDHAQHASQHPMGTEQSLLTEGGATTAHGERPLWEFGEIPYERPLGDVAREYRASHRYGSKIVFEKQGQ